MEWWKIAYTGIKAYLNKEAPPPKLTPKQQEHLKQAQAYYKELMTVPFDFTKDDSRYSDLIVAELRAAASDGAINYGLLDPGKSPASIQKEIDDRRREYDALQIKSREASFDKPPPTQDEVRKLFQRVVKTELVNRRKASEGRKVSENYLDFNMPGSRGLALDLIARHAIDAGINDVNQLIYSATGNEKQVMSELLPEITQHMSDLRARALHKATPNTLLPVSHDALGQLSSPTNKAPRLAGAPKRQ